MKVDALMLNACKQAFSFTPRELALILIGGLGFFWGFPNSLGQPPAALPSPALLFTFSLAGLALTAKGSTKAAAGAICTFIMGGLLATYWLSYPMINFGQVPLPLAFIFLILMGVALSVYYVIFVLLLRFFQVRLPLALALIAGGLTWGALEFFRGSLFTGLTWFSLSSAMMGRPIWAQGASLVGMFGLSSVYALAALLFIPLLLRRCGLEIGKKTFWLCPLTGCLLLAALPLYGGVRLHYADMPPDEGRRDIILAQAQGNIDQAQKWQPEMQAATVRHYVLLSEKALNQAEEKFGRQADLLVWPETAMPFYFQPDSRLAAPLRALTAERGIPLLFGAPGMDMGPDGQESYNRVWLLNEQGDVSGHYDKEHLVPFGEYIPKGFYVPFASEFLQGYGFTPGQTKEPLRLRDISLGVLICYEGIFPELAQARVAAGANLLVNVSNDAWFADSPAPWQHLQLSAMRAIEQGRYMLRCTNTGVSALIDPLGRIQDAGPLFQSYVSSYKIKGGLLEEKTFFHRHYALITRITAYSPLFFIGLSLIMPLIRRRRR
ncbi:MAG: apolipoprotein N-acyltransferase [Deltaproteobacteria bacterium]|jgi:apolipoprotein N-acyltransferase|nr:apolipoprotein N-acyltransferase [Deltaproteobacteria bacterium]